MGVSTLPIKTVLKPQPKLTCRIGAIFVCVFLSVLSLQSALHPTTEAEATRRTLLMARAKIGDPKAQVEVADLYAAVRNYKKARDWYYMGAMSGELKAQTRYGILCLEGLGGNRESKEAVRWLHLAAQRGDSKAYLRLGTCFRDAVGVEKDFIEAHKWFLLAEKAGDKKSVQSRINSTRNLGYTQLEEARARASIFKPNPELKPNMPTPRPSVLERIRMEMIMISTGTGFFVSRDGFIVTAHHVIEDAETFHIEYNGSLLPAKLIDGAPDWDVALLKVEGVFPALSVNYVSDLQRGTPVFTIGFPPSAVEGIRDAKLTSGQISRPRVIPYTNWQYVADVDADHGNSGGPLVNRYGNVVGVISSKSPELAERLGRPVTRATQGRMLERFFIQVRRQSQKHIPENSSEIHSLEQLAKKVSAATVRILAE